MLAMTDPCRLGEWVTRIKPYLPLDKPPPGHAGHRVDHMVIPLKERWIYTLVRRKKQGGAFEIPFEGWVDEEGYVWFNEHTDVTLSVRERPDPREGPLSLSHVQFPKVNELGNALETRLLCSPFRLPSMAAKAVNETGYHASICDHIPPLWSWNYGEDPNSPVNSKDGYSLSVEPLWMKFPKEAEVSPVLVGSDPFAIAVRRSNLYVKNRRAFAKRFEPSNFDRQNELARLMLAQTITDSILRVPQAKERYGKVIDISKINRALEAHDKERIGLQAKINRSGKNLCKFLRSDLFAFLQYASLEEELYDPSQDYCEPVADHMRVLEAVTRQLDRCKDGCELMIKWSRDADVKEHHFLSRTVLPARPLDVHVFKTMRWGGKGTLNLFRKLGPYFLARKSDILADIGDLLVRLGAIEKVDLIPQAFKYINIRTSELAAAHGFQLRGDRVLKVKLLGQQLRAKFIQYADQGTTWLSKLPPEMGQSKFLAFAALDVINVALSLKALAKAEGPNALAKAGAGSAAALGFLAGSVMTPIIEAMPKGAKQSRRLRMLYGGQAVCAGVYCLLDVIAGFEAIDKDDNDRAVFLFLAALAEAISAGYYVWMAASASSGGIGLVVLGAAAAISYIAAMLLEDDPLEEFLENCEWGTKPYGRAGYEPSWADEPVWAWKGNYDVQQQTLLRVLSRFTISWDLHSWPDIKVETSLVRPGTRLRVVFDAEYADGTDDSIEKVFGPASLPRGPSVAFQVGAGKPYKEHNAREIKVRVQFQPDAGAEEEVLEATLMTDGKGKTYGRAGRVL